jgi:hypothetical protein
MKNSITVGDLKYLYDPFEATVYEVYVREIINNMFEEPDEIYAKIRVYADEKSVKNNKESWENVKNMTSFSYLSGNLTNEKEAISAFHTDMALKASKLEDKLSCLKNTISQIGERKIVINSSEK